ncbi:type II toxin-antitoxin system Phd/YefM family antitoxin [Mobiluncus mulieris]|uniref:type II toxin-antitoxin system Phd/YefM family antitoxin n=1 Tax=Mobiluncus mulieris TaxID=2052 RepID=UPI00056323A9|nr:type II toxin-antitoxin system prevent-host-death family antitoxin [Mobiluncus mulieris]
MSQVGLRELGQNASEVLRRVAAGEVLTVTNRRRPVAWLVPWQESPLARLQNAGMVRAAKASWEAVSKPLPATGAMPASAVLAELREAERY